MSNRFDYKSRLPVNLIADKIKEVLPEHYVTEYPDLVKFMEVYYQYLEEDDKGFSYLIQGLYQVRDIDSTLLSSLDNLLKEIGNNTQSADYFADPRFIAKIIASFYKAKGTRLSAEGFFRAFFNENATISYPKNNMFIVNESQLGPNSLRYIQDAERYQIHSILIKSGISLSTWESLYKTFIHPAGWYLAGDVALEGVYNANLGVMPLSIEDSDAGKIILSSAVNMDIGVQNSISAIFRDDGDSDTFAERFAINTTLGKFLNATIDNLDQQYNSIIEFGDENSPTFDTGRDGTGSFFFIADDKNTMEIELDGNLVVSGDITANVDSSDINTIIDSASVEIGSWNIGADSIGNLLFTENDLNKMKLDTSSNLSVTGDISTYKNMGNIDSFDADFITVGSWIVSSDSDKNLLFSTGPINTINVVLDISGNLSVYGDISTNSNTDLMSAVPNIDSDSVIVNNWTLDGDGSGIKAVDLSNTIETMDKTLFDYWDSDNNVYQYPQTS